MLMVRSTPEGSKPMKEVARETSYSPLGRGIRANLRMISIMVAACGQHPREIDTRANLRMMTSTALAHTHTLMAIESQGNGGVENSWADKAVW